MERLKKLVLNENSVLLPLGVVVSIISVLIGGTVWLTTMYNKSEAQATTIAEYQHQLEDIRNEEKQSSDRIYNVQIQLEAIRGRLDTLATLIKGK